MSSAAAEIAALLQTGNRLRDAGDLAGAAAAFVQALQSAPDLPEALIDLALTLQQQGRIAECEPFYLRALAAAPGRFDARQFYAFFLHETGRHEEALEAYRRGLELRPDWGEGHLNRGQLFQLLRRTKQAVRCYAEALRCGGADATTLANLAAAFEEFGLYDKALEAADRALRLEPGHVQARYNRSRALVALGRWEEGWREYEIRPCKPVLTRPEWRGEAFAGKTLLLRKEQGFGDNIAALRFARRVKERGGIVLAEADPALRRLLEDCPGIDGVVADPGEADADLEAALPSLPALLGIVPETIPAEGPYFDVPLWTPEERARRLGAEGAIDTRPRIGIVWAGAQADARRSAPPGPLFALADDGRFAVHSLQFGAAGREALQALGYEGRIVDLGSGFSDFYDTAQAFQEMDLVLTIDTGAAHLAGALGRPTWLLLMQQSYWIYDQGPGSPWYPAMALFRQPLPGDWDGVFRQVAERLDRMFPKKAATPGL